jgi:hypothetical protein
MRTIFLLLLCHVHVMAFFAFWKDSREHAREEGLVGFEKSAAFTGESAGERWKLTVWKLSWGFFR